MAGEAIQTEGVKKSENELIRDALKKLKAGETREVVFQGLPEDLKLRIEEELNRIETQKTDNKPADELIPIHLRGLTSRALDEQWIVNSEDELEKNRKIAALEALKKEEVEFLNGQKKEIERATREQITAARIQQIYLELDMPHEISGSPLTLSEGEIQDIFDHSTDRTSFQEHLKTAYLQKVEHSGMSLQQLTLHAPKAIPKFLKDSVQEKYGK